MKLTRTEINLLVSFISDPMHGENLRTRNKVFSIVKEPYFDTEERRKAILVEFSDKDESGKAKFDPRGNYEIPADKLGEAKVKIEKLLLEEIDLSSLDNKTWNWVRSQMLESKKTLDIAEGVVYDDLISKIEAK